MQMKVTYLPFPAEINSNIETTVHQRCRNSERRQSTVTGHNTHTHTQTQSRDQ